MELTISIWKLGIITLKTYQSFNNFFFMRDLDFDPGYDIEVQMLCGCVLGQCHVERVKHFPNVWGPEVCLLAKQAF